MLLDLSDARSRRARGPAPDARRRRRPARLRPVGARRGRRPHPRAGERRRRLRHQAVLGRGGRRPPARAAAPPARARGLARRRRRPRARAAGRRARRGARDLDLTRREFELLALFMRHPGEVLERRRLHEEVWGYRSTRARTSPTCSSATCGASSRRRASRASCTRCAGSASCCEPDGRAQPPRTPDARGARRPRRVLAVAGVLVARDIDRTNRQALDDRLRRTAELSQATALAAVEQELPDVDRRLDAVLGATRSSLRLAIGRTVLLDSGLSLPLPLGSAPGLRTLTIRGERYRVLTSTLREESLGGLVWLQVASSLDEVEDRQGVLRGRLAGVGALMLLVAGVGVWLAADLVLRPLRRLRTVTTGVAGEGDLERRVPVGGAAELRSLAESFNAMLVRLSRSAEDRTRALEATRRFAADAGHELRTPLTSVQASLSAIARHPEMDAGRRTELAQDALAEQRRLVHLLDGLQALARGDAEPGRPAPVDLAEVVDDERRGGPRAASRGAHPERLAARRRAARGLGAGAARARRQPRRERRPARPPGRRGARHPARARRRSRRARRGRGRRPRHPRRRAHARVRAVRAVERHGPPGIRPRARARRPAGARCTAPRSASATRTSAGRASPCASPAERATRAGRPARGASRARPRCAR